MHEQFVLFSKDRPLIKFSSRKNQKYEISEMCFVDANRHLLPFELRGDLTSVQLEAWLARRISHIGRRTLACIEQARALDKDDILRFVKLTHGLSLNDTFWLDDAESSLTWKDTNLYYNDFSEELSLIGLDSPAVKAIHMASRSPQYTVKGAMSKCWFRRDGKTLLCKSDGKVRPFLSSQACMEWVASRVASAFGIDHVPYWLEARNTRKGMTTTCLCGIFTSVDRGFVEASRYYQWCGVPTETLRNEDFFRDAAFQRRLADLFPRERMEDMMVFDYLIGNTDRHMGNYGLLFDTNDGKILGPAPIFDNGLSFFSWDEAPNTIDEVEDWIRENDTSTLLTDRDQLEEFLKPRHLSRIERVAALRFSAMPAFGFHRNEATFLEKFLSVRATQALSIFAEMYSEEEEHPRHAP